MSRDASAECFGCGAPATDTFGNEYLCSDCRPGESRATQDRGTDLDQQPFAPWADCANPEADPDENDDAEAGVWSCDGWERTDGGRRMWPAVLREYAQFMTLPVGEKFGFVPWGDPDHPAENPDKDARYKWALPDM